MRTARETRQAAWNALARRQYWTFVGGAFVQNLLVWAGTLLAAVVMLLAFAALAFGLFGSELVDAFGSADRFEDLLYRTMVGFGPVVFVVIAGIGLFIVVNILLLPLAYFAGFARWGVIRMCESTADASIRFEDAFSGWGHGWKLAWVIVVRGTYVCLWALLFVVPGVVKAFSYAMTDYIAFEHPDWTASECVTLSRRLMDGNKWRLFCLELSFIGWYVLLLVVNYIANGLGSVFLNPYLYSAEYAFYRELKASCGV